MSLSFEWDRRKAASNLNKHDVSFSEAATVFGDPLSLTIPTIEHSRLESRYLILGSSYRARLLVVAYTERSDRIRIISARRATRRERRDYEQAR